MYLRGSRYALSCEKWKSQLLTLSDQNFVTDRPVPQSESDFVRPFFLRTVGQSQNFHAYTHPTIFTRKNRPWTAECRSAKFHGLIYKGAIRRY